MVTTYATNAAGEAAYHDLTTVRTLAYLCASLRGRIATKFARHKLGDDDARGANVITPSSLRARDNCLVWRVGSSRFGWGKKSHYCWLAS